MSRPDDSPSTPADATQVTAEQRAVQDELNRQDEDPNAPGRHQSRHQIADET